MTTNEWKTKFLRAQDPDQRMRIVGQAYSEEGKARGHKFERKDEPITIEFTASWTDSVAYNLLHVLELDKGLKLLHDDHLFMVKTIGGDLVFSKHTTAQDLYGYAEKLATAVGKRTHNRRPASTGDGDADLIS